MAVKVRSPATGVGTRRLSLSPLPSRPYRPDPQQYAAPEAVSPQVCAPPEDKERVLQFDVWLFSVSWVVFSAGAVVFSAGVGSGSRLSYDEVQRFGDRCASAVGDGELDGECAGFGGGAGDDTGGLVDVEAGRQPVS